MTSQTLKIVLVVVMMAVIAVCIPNTNSFVILLATRALAFAILVMSVDILLGFTGLASLGQAAYFGVGAYLTAILANNYGFGLKWDFWLMVPLGMLVGAALAAFFGLFAIRATGTYFLMITLALGQAAYLGMGAYATAILATKYQIGLGWDFWLVLLLGMAMGAALAAVFGLLAIRATGVYFLMITLALGQCVWGLAYRWNSLTGGDNGINLRQRPKFGIDLADEKTFFFLVFAIFCVALVLMYTIVRSPFGRSLLGIRERELRMQILGYNTWLHKYIAFIIAGAFGGLSGVLWAHTAGIVSPVNVELPTSVDALLMAVLGGSGTLVGGVIGTFIVFGLREFLSTLVPWWQYVLGVVYVATILYLPTGLMGIPERVRQRKARSANREGTKTLAPATP